MASHVGMDSSARPTYRHREAGATVGMVDERP